MVNAASPATTGLELKNVECQRDDRILFSGVDLSLPVGGIVQVLGPNGSGKTTLLRLIAGVGPEHSGDIYWRALPVAQNRLEFRRDLLFIGHTPGIKKALTPLENLRWLGQLAGETSSEDVHEASLAQVGLRGYEDVPCVNLSAGQLRRVALARLYHSQAPLWILDEPFTALDTSGIRVLEAQIEAHANAGGCVLLTSHQPVSVASLVSFHLLDFAAGSNAFSGVV